MKIAIAGMGYVGLSKGILLAQHNKALIEDARDLFGKNT